MPNAPWGTKVRPEERIILAMDVSELTLADEIAHDIADLVGPMKIGLEAISADIAHKMADVVDAAGGRTFWDGKWGDIPNTVAGAAKGLLKRHPFGIWAFNAHATGGIPMMGAAVANRGDSLVLAVTLLTSLGEEEAQRIYRAPVEEVVLQGALDAKDAGVQGLICSPQEAEMLRSHPELDGLIIVTPAIRPDWSVPADQKRPTTPRKAILAGADFLVVGRAITDPPEGYTRRSAAEAIVQEVREAIAEREASA
jgi:orotidine-5'-phosphate decarboxylase